METTIFLSLPSLAILDVTKGTSPHLSSCRSITSDQRLVELWPSIPFPTIACTPKQGKFNQATLSKSFHESRLQTSKHTGRARATASIRLGAKTKWARCRTDRIYGRHQGWLGRSPIV